MDETEIRKAFRRRSFQGRLALNEFLHMCHDLRVKLLHPVRTYEVLSGAAGDEADSPEYEGVTEETFIGLVRKFRDGTLAERADFLFEIMDKDSSGGLDALEVLDIAHFLLDLPVFHPPTEDMPDGSHLPDESGSGTETLDILVCVAFADAIEYGSTAAAELVPSDPSSDEADGIATGGKSGKVGDVANDRSRDANEDKIAGKTEVENDAEKSGGSVSIGDEAMLELPPLMPTNSGGGTSPRREGSRKRMLAHMPKLLSTTRLVRESSAASLSRAASNKSTPGSPFAPTEGDRDVDCDVDADGDVPWLRLGEIIDALEDVEINRAQFSWMFSVAMTAIAMGLSISNDLGITTDQLSRPRQVKKPGAENTGPQVQPAPVERVSPAEREAFEKRCASQIRDGDPGLTRDGFMAIFDDLFREHSTVSWLFDVMDSDGNGFVSTDEALEVVARGLRGTVEERLSFFFSLYDRNNDGTLSVVELHRMLMETLKGRRVVVEHPDMDHVHQLADNGDITVGTVESSASRLLIVAIDRDHSGKVSRDEWTTGAASFLSVAARVAPMIATLWKSQSRQRASKNNNKSITRSGGKEGKSGKSPERSASVKRDASRNIFDIGKRGGGGGGGDESLDPFRRSPILITLWLAATLYSAMSFSAVLGWPQDHALRLEREIGWTAGQIGLLMIVYQIGSIPGNWFSGMITNRLGLVKSSFAVGGIILVASIVCAIAVMSKTFALALVGRVLQGCTESVFTIQTLAISRHLLPSQQEVAQSVLGLFRLVGFLIGRLAWGPLPFEAIGPLQVFHGFSLLVFAVVASATDMAIRKACGRVGADGRGSGEQTLAQTLGSLLVVAEPSAASVAALPRVFWVNCVSACFVVGFIFTFGSLGSFLLADVEAVQRGSDPSISLIALYMSIQIMVGMASAIPVSMLTSRYGRRGEFIAAMSTFFVLAAALPGFDVSTGALVIALFYAIGAGLTQMIIQNIMTIYLLPTPDLIGTAVGVIYALMATSIALFTYVVSYLFENPPSDWPAYRAPFLVLFSFAVAGTVASVWLIFEGKNARGGNLLGRPTIRKKIAVRKFLVSGSIPGAIVTVRDFEEVKDDDNPA